MLSFPDKIKDDFVCFFHKFFIQRYQALAIEYDLDNKGFDNLNSPWDRQIPPPPDSQPKLNGTD